MGSAKKHFFLGLVLIGISALIYTVQLLLFHDAHNTFFYIFQDLAFLPISTLLVTFILEQLIASREKSSKLEKMNMVIGAFYSEVGIELIKHCSRFDKDYLSNKCKLTISDSWTDKDFDRLADRIKSYKFNMDFSIYSPNELKTFLVSKRDFLLNLLGNPVLLEHDTFTDLLWSIFHINEEFLYRKRLDNLSRADSEHLSKDLERVYGLLIYEWIYYLKHTRDKYPYLFSLSLRANPFINEIEQEVTE